MGVSAVRCRFATTSRTPVRWWFSCVGADRVPVCRSRGLRRLASGTPQTPWILITGSSSIRRLKAVAIVMGHVAAVAGRADAAALAGEGHDESRAACHADCAGEAEAEEPALEIAAKVPAGKTLASVKLPNNNDLGILGMALI
jgi:hypothetical protein